MAATSEKTVVRHWATLASSVPSAFTSVFTETAALVFSDQTTNANSAAAGDVVMTGANAVGAILYMGMSANRFDFVRLVFSVARVGGVVAWEYWNGSAWSALTVATVTGSANMTSATNELSWTPPADWATTAINGATNFWIRARTTTIYTSGTGSYFSPGVIPVLPTLTIDAPETTTRTITSAVLKFDYHVDTQANGSTVASSQAHTRVSVALGAVALSYVVDNAADVSLGSSGGNQQNQSLIVDCTSYFQSNFGAGATQTCVVTFSGCKSYGVSSAGTSLPAMEGFGVELIMTYSVDESAQDTRVKTVWIPLESNTGQLTTSLASMGTNQIPNLDTFLPEASKTYKEKTLVITGNTYQTAAGARTLSYALDAAAATAIATMTCTTTLNACTDVFYIDLSAMTTNAAHDLKLKTSSTTIGPYGHVVAYLVVTYTYSHTSSTTILNSLLQTAPLQTDDVQGIADPSLFRFNINIQEPATVTLAQSGVLLRWNSDGGGTGSTGNPNVKIGSQSSRAYSSTTTTAIGGDFPLMQRFDSGSAQGAGITIARGQQTLDVQLYSTSFPSYVPVAMMFLNYTSAKSGLGAHAHNHTVFNIIRAINASSPIAFTADASVSTGFTITPASYWICSLGYWFNWFNVSTGSQGIDIHAKIQSGEIASTGYASIMSFTTQLPGVGSGIVTSQKYTDKTSIFKRWANDWNASNLLNPKNSRIYRTVTPNSVGVIPMLMSIVTYNSITTTASGTVLNFTGNGSGITVTIHRNDTGEKMATATTAVGGGYTVTECFDSTISHFSEARQDGTHLGRSEIFNPS